MDERQGDSGGGPGKEDGPDTGGDGLVLVTGGSGFVATQCIAQLLAEGRRVRTTVRSEARAGRVRQSLRHSGIEPDERLSFAGADLTADQGWAGALAGVRSVLHVASPFPAKVPKHEDELIVPAREGALRVLRAARDAGVRRVVLTSSFAAVGYGHPPRTRPYTEADWTDSDHAPTAYIKSKTLAERAAWDFVAREGDGLELAVVNPVGVLGPVAAPDVSASVEIVKRLMDGSIPGCPRLSYAYVDVRDVADLHLRALTAPGAAGERFLAVSGEPLSMRETALLLKDRLGDVASRVPTRRLPDWVVRLFARFDGAVAQIVPDLGVVRRVSSEKARRELGWSPRPPEEAVMATAESLVRLRLLGC